MGKFTGVVLAVIASLALTGCTNTKAEECATVIAKAGDVATSIETFVNLDMQSTLFRDRLRDALNTLASVRLKTPQLADSTNNFIRDAYLLKDELENTFGHSDEVSIAKATAAAKLSASRLLAL